MNNELIALDIDVVIDKTDVSALKSRYVGASSYTIVILKNGREIEVSRPIVQVAALLGVKL